LPRIHRTQIYRTLDDLESLRPAWEALLEDFSGATTFSTWEWLAPWWRAFGEGRELLVLAFFDESEKLVGLAPLQISRRRVTSFLNLRVLGLWGDGSGDSDNLDIPVRAGWEESVTLALLEFLKKESSQWDYCEFNTMPEDSPVGGILRRALLDGGWTQAMHRLPRMLLELPGTWDEYLKEASPKERENLRYYQRRVEKRYRVRVFNCTEEQDFAAGLETLIRLHELRWHARGLPGTFASSSRRQFYSQLGRLLLVRGWLEFWLLELDGKPVAAQFGYRYRETVYCLQQGFDPEFGAVCVQDVLRTYVLQHLLRQGVRHYDFLMGMDIRKLRWGATPKEYMNIHFARPFSRGSFYLWALQNARGAKESLRARLHPKAWAMLHALNSWVLGAPVVEPEKQAKARPHEHSTASA
jgi:CelD/BcsL family acetyltransferase involved in cellulose biosynthesis